MTRTGPAPPEQGDDVLRDKLLAGRTADLDAAGHLEQVGGILGRRLVAEPETVERSVAQLVLTFVELFRQAAEREALSRIDDLPEEKVEPMGRGLMLMDRRVGELCEAFGLTRADVSRGLSLLARLV